MKAIDEKGRVFGKLNLIDLVVVLVLIALVVGVAWKLVGGKISNAVAANNAVTVQYEVLCTNVDRAVADYCMENSNGQLMSRRSAQRICDRLHHGTLYGVHHQRRGKHSFLSGDRPAESALYHRVPSGAGQQRL